MMMMMMMSIFVWYRHNSDDDDAHHVLEPPTWTLEPKDRAVILGHSVTFDAKAEAFPEPIIRWKRSFGNCIPLFCSLSPFLPLPPFASCTLMTHMRWSHVLINHRLMIVNTDGENFKVIISNANIQTLENGSLTIREVTREDGGHYMVQAINGVGPGISHVVKLTVKGQLRRRHSHAFLPMQPTSVVWIHLVAWDLIFSFFPSLLIFFSFSRITCFRSTPFSPPADSVGAHFEKKFESHAIKKGDGIRLRCKALGEKPVSVSWSKDRLPISSNTEPRYITFNLLLLFCSSSWSSTPF